MKSSSWRKIEANKTVGFDNGEISSRSKARASRLVTHSQESSRGSASHRSASKESMKERKIKIKRIKATDEKSSVLNLLKDKVVRIILLTGRQQKAGTTEEEPITNLLDEVDIAMRKSKLFSMTQLTGQEDQKQEDKRSLDRKVIDKTIESIGIGQMKHSHS